MSAVVHGVDVYEKVDEALDYNLHTGLFKWKVLHNGQCKNGWFSGCEGNHGYYVFQVRGKLLLAHRVAYYIHHREIPPGAVDHINGDRKDNRIANLRSCTHSQNMMNQKVRTDSTSGVSGVGWHKHARKWRARICFEGRDYSLGLFTSRSEAIKARQEAEQLYFGEFAPNHLALEE